MLWPKCSTLPLALLNLLRFIGPTFQACLSPFGWHPFLLLHQLHNLSVLIYKLAEAVCDCSMSLIKLLKNPSAKWTTGNTTPNLHYVVALIFQSHSCRILELQKLKPQFIIIFKKNCDTYFSRSYGRIFSTICVTSVALTSRKPLGWIPLLAGYKYFIIFIKYITGQNASEINPFSFPLKALTGCFVNTAECIELRSLVEHHWFILCPMLLQPLNKCQLRVVGLIVSLAALGLKEASVTISWHYRYYQFPLISEHSGTSLTPDKQTSCANGIHCVWGLIHDICTLWDSTAMFNYS